MGLFLFFSVFKIYTHTSHNFMELSSYSLKEEINIILESQAIETFFDISEYYRLSR